MVLVIDRGCYDKILYYYARYSLISTYEEKETLKYRVLVTVLGFFRTYQDGQLLESLLIFYLALFFRTPPDSYLREGSPPQELSSDLKKGIYTQLSK